MIPQPKPIVLYCYRTDGSFRMITGHFNHRWEARRFLEVLWNAEPWNWENERMTTDPQLMTSTGIRVRGAQLDAVVNHDYTRDEFNLTLCEGDVRRARQIMTALPDPEEVAEAIQQERATRRAAKEERPKIDRAGKVTIGEIAEDLDMDAKEARSILRSLKWEKPLGGWLFDPGEVDAVKEQLAANRKEG